MLDVISYMFSLSIPCLKRFAKSLRNHALGVLAWFDYQTSTGPLKGLNNKIKVIKRKAYGFRNMDYFKLKILSCHIRRPYSPRNPEEPFFPRKQPIPRSSFRHRAWRNRAGFAGENSRRQLGGGRRRGAARFRKCKSKRW